MNHSAFFAKGAGKAPAESFCLERKSDQRMFRELFDKKKERDNLERYDDKRRNDNRGNRDTAKGTITAEAAARDPIART